MQAVRYINLNAVIQQTLQGNCAAMRWVLVVALNAYDDFMQWLLEGDFQLWSCNYISITFSTFLCVKDLF